MNLFDVNSAIENFEFKVDEETGEILNLDELDNLKMKKDEKIENIALYIKNLKAQEKALDEEQRVMYARKKATTNKRQRLEGYLSRFMKGNKFESSKCNKNGEKMGTGLGLYIVKATINEYKGSSVKVLHQPVGFAIKIKFKI